MFTQLQPLLAQCKSLVVIINMTEDGQISVITQPKAENNAPAGLRTQLALSGTAQELDDGFADAILSHAKSLKTITEQMEDSKAHLAADQKRLAEEAAKKRSKVPATSIQAAGSSTLTDTNDDDDEKSKSKKNSPNPTTTVIQAPVAEVGMIELF